MEQTNELYHWGVKGMKWGVRRYQNKDGTLTAAGKKRMYREQFDMESKERKEQRKYTADTNRWVKEDMERTKRLTDSSKQLTNELKNANEKSIKNAKRKQMDLSQMSDKELRDQINRAFLEKQYNDMFNPPQVSKGREYAGKVLENAGTALAITSSALGVALAIKELRG
jgi:hypothetical protein